MSSTTMMRTICKSKLHKARVTDANVEYAGSLSLDTQLMRAARLVPYEQVHVLDLDNGARVVTYCIEAPPGSGTVCANGAAARLIRAGDHVIVLSYAQVDEAELARFTTTIVMLDHHNRIDQVVTTGPQFTTPDDAPLPSSLAAS